MGIFDDNYGIVNIEDRINKFCEKFLVINNMYSQERNELYEEFKATITKFATKITRGKERAMDSKNYILFGIRDFKLIGRGMVGVYNIKNRWIFENVWRCYEEGTNDEPRYLLWTSSSKYDKLKNGKRDNMGFAVYAIDNVIFDLLIEAIKKNLHKF